jgi:hypothetical protein
LDAADSLGSASDIIDPIAPEWKQNTTIRLLVVDVYQRHTFIAIDVNNHAYNFGTAHRDTTVIPVYSIREAKRTGNWVMTKEPKWDEYVAQPIGELHKWNGFEIRPPYLEDQNTVIEHTNLRETNVLQE